MMESKNDNNPKIITYENVTIDDVIGLDEIKEYFRDTLVYYYKNKERCNKLGIRQTKGIILEGAPGVGKTLVCAACINSYGNKSMELKLLDSSELTSNQKGESEKMIKKIFDNVKKDTLIVIDEIDGLCPSRRKLSSVLAKEITTALIKALDRNKHISLVGTTNFIEDIDAAIIRRVDKVIKVPYPTSKERAKFFELCLKNIPLDDTVSIDNLAKESDGFTGNDILSILKNQLGMVYLHKQDDVKDAKITQDEILDILYNIRKDNLPKIETVEDRIFNLLEGCNGNGMYVKDIVNKTELLNQNVSRALVSMAKKKIVTFDTQGRNRLYRIIRN